MGNTFATENVYYPMRVPVVNQNTAILILT